MDATRQRRVHKKSRHGCGNCKMRRVKCDELRPHCAKCLSFGVSCDYEPTASDLEFAGVGSFKVEILKPPTPPETPPRSAEEIIESMIDAPLHLHVDQAVQLDDTCYIDEPHLELLRKFYYRTSRTIGTAESFAVYRDCMIREAANYSFVLHALLRFTLMHDRYLYDPLGTKPSAAEAFHSYHGVALFGQKLSESVEEEAKDALWGTAAILGASTFANIEATCAQEAWPLKAPEPTDLDWLKMSEGKKAVWRMVDPLREGSSFRAAIEAEHNKKETGFHKPLEPELEKLFPYVTQMYHLNSSNPQDPYHTAASIVERLLPIECTHSTVMWFLSFIGHMEPEYRSLLEEKDPAAMLLLAWWYAKMMPYDMWWLHRRAAYECEAICLFLDRELPPQHEIRRLLEFPRRVCGAQQSSLPEARDADAASTAFPWKQVF